MEEKEMDFIPLGDNGKEIDSDYRMSDFGEVLDKIKAMPKLDLDIRNRSQYTDKRYYTGCTVMSAINALQTMLNITFTDAEVSSIYDLAEKNGRKPGNGWARGSGWNTVRQWWNEKNPNNQVLMFVINLFSEEFYEVINKLGIIGISLSVDAKYRKDAKDNLRIDLEGFAKTTGHASCMMKTTEYICPDSVPKAYSPQEYKKAMIYARGGESKIKELNTRANIRTDAHIFIMEKRIQEVDPVEQERLRTFKSKLEQAIQINSDIWNLTTEETERAERKRQNDYNRSKLKIVESMLK